MDVLVSEDRVIASDDTTAAVQSAGMQGAARLVVARIDGTDRLADLYQATPLRILFPYPLPGDPLTAALVNTSGGLVGGDQLQLAVTVGAGAKALVCAQAAEKVYRSSGLDSRIDIDLAIGAGGWLEMLPQETILFDGARLRRRSRVDLAGDAQFLGGEILVFGRQARGERLRHGLVHDGWEIRRDGKLSWVDRLRLEGDLDALIAQRSALDGAAAAASLIFAAPDAASHLPALRAQLEGFPGQASATCVNGILVARWLADDPLILRQAFAKAWIFLRITKKMPASLPRLWHI
ncbi:MAG TPA: urease accessory protein UreD [Terriglobales bacterium]|nr:urease accessory protein UreD [Terriglobales bacterium]